MFLVDVLRVQLGAQRCRPAAFGRGRRGMRRARLSRALSGGAACRKRRVRQRALVPRASKTESALQAGVDFVLSLSCGARVSVSACADGNEISCIPAAELTELCQLRVVSRIFNVALQHRLQADVSRAGMVRCQQTAAGRLGLVLLKLDCVSQLVLQLFNLCREHALLPLILRRKPQIESCTLQIDHVTPGTEQDYSHLFAARAS